jgi:hypothetical protein
MLASDTLLIHLRIVGIVMASLVAVNLIVPSRFHWREEMARLSLVNRQIFQAHGIWHLSRPDAGAHLDVAAHLG